MTRRKVVDGRLKLYVDFGTCEMEVIDNSPYFKHHFDMSDMSHVAHLIRFTNELWEEVCTYRKQKASEEHWKEYDKWVDKQVTRSKKLS